MFKKLKDKLAEEVKSSPQRIQQFAQAAQAAVTSASSSISDITNNDLFSIGDNDNSQSRSVRTPTSVTRAPEQNMFHDVSLMQSANNMQASTEDMDFTPRQDQSDGQHQRRLSNSSFASDVSFRLPSYESPSLYHLQSDMEVSASEAEERGFSSGTASLDRVTKEQLYAAYKRTQQRYEKYRTQYADLARHYKFLERDNAKARSVLVETQDKALRRISELREQCTLEQSAKAHLEKALRLEIDEKNMKIESLNTKISFIQNDPENKELPHHDSRNKDEVCKESINELQLIDFSGANDRKTSGDDGTDAALNSKTEKLEQLVSKYKESLKQSKEKNAQLTTELHILSNEIENKRKENEQLKENTIRLTEAQQKILKLQEINEEFQNELNTYEFNKMKEKSTIELDLQKALEEIEQLRGKIEVFNKREEEYAISLAENKLSIHKELETKEAEIKSLKDNLTASKNEIQSLNIVITDYKKSLFSMEEEKNKLNGDINELYSLKNKITEKESVIKDLVQKCKSLEQTKAKGDEEYKCLQLQHKQETAEKLAMIDRNSYLETKNTQLSEDNIKKSSQIHELENKLLKIDKEKNESQNIETDTLETNKILEELESWRNKYYTMESEIQEERDELVKLQSEIEKLLQNHEVIQTQNSELHDSVTELTTENSNLKCNNNKINKICKELTCNIKALKETLSLTLEDVKMLKHSNATVILNLNEKLNAKIKENEIGHQDKLEKLKNDYEASQLSLLEINERMELTTKELIASQSINDQLKSQIQAYISENAVMLEEIRKSENNHEVNLRELNKIKDDKDDLLSKIGELETSNKSLQDTIIELKKSKDDNIALLSKIAEFETSNKSLQNTISELNKTKDDSVALLSKIAEFETTNKALEETISELIKTKDDNIPLMSKIAELETTNKSLQGTFSELNKLKDDNNALLRKICEIETINKSLQGTITQEREQHSPLHDKIPLLEKEQQTLLQKLKNIQDENDQLKTVSLELEALKVVNQDLLAKNKAVEENKMYAKKLEDDVKALSQENTSLKNQSQSIAINLKALEEEISDVRKSHAEIESEKDHLNATIKKLEESEDAKKAKSAVEIQTDETSLAMNLAVEENKILKEKCEQIKQEKELLYEKVISVENERETLLADTAVQNSKLEEENKSLKLTNSELSMKISELNKIYNELKAKVEESNKITNEFSSLKTEYDVLKNENRHLSSDIEGLQIHLAKVSKENSTLNDKVRELIASAEHVDQKLDLNELQNGQSDTEKLNDLLRENTLLIEENLELKDQLRSQNYVETPNNNSKSFNAQSEFDILKEKYSSVLATKSKYEKQLMDLEHINRSVNGNLQNVQENNEKLRLSNEKLERRLDEALVSLRHLHSLQENTELEYLRNILYEYLTGSGTHSITLAKVLAAVVKFDEMQTNIVMQKEKERQGLLRQLGLL